MVVVCCLFGWPMSGCVLVVVGRALCDDCCCLSLVVCCFSFVDSRLSCVACFSLVVGCCLLLVVTCITIGRELVVC